MTLKRSTPRPVLQLFAATAMALLLAAATVLLGAAEAGAAGKGSAQKVSPRSKTQAHASRNSRTRHGKRNYYPVKPQPTAPSTPAPAPAPTPAPAPAPAPTPAPAPAPAPAPGPTPAPAPAPAPTPAPTPTPTPAPTPTPTPTPAPAPAPTPTAKALLSTGFEEGLKGWNTAGVGEVIPTTTTSNVHSGSKAGRFLLTGSQNRSELILGGSGSYNTDGSPQFREGEEYWYGFSFRIEKMVWGRPGAHNLMMQFKSEGEGSPNFGLDLWNYAGDDGRSGGKGLWTEGGAMGGNRFLAPLAEQTWYEIAIHFKASSSGAGFYEVFLNGKLVDARTNISMIRSGRGYAYIKNGLYRNGTTAPGTSELLLDDAALGTERGAVTAS